MEEIIFDFNRIGSMNDFYAIAANKFKLPDYFGKNLDALWDCVTGNIELPVTIRFIHLSLSQLEQFDALITLFQDAEKELAGGFTFEYYIQKE